MLPPIRQLISRIEQLEEDIRYPETERLEAWRKLVQWFNWTRQFDDQQAMMTAFEALPLGDPLRDLYDALIWGFRHFAPMIPAEARVNNWLDKGKLCFEAFICGSLRYIDDNQYDLSELFQKDYLDECISWTVKQLQDTEGWREYDERIAQQQIKNQLGVKRYQASYSGNREAIEWLKKNDPDFNEADYAKPFPSVEKVITTDPTPDPVTVQTESTARGEVPNNAIIEAAYIGGKNGFSIMTVNGLQKIIKGQRYRLPGHIWQNILFLEEEREWKRL